MNKEIICKNLSKVLTYGLSLPGAAKRIAVGRDSDSRAAESALCAGITRNGGDAILIGKCIKPELYLASRIADCDLCVYIKDGETIRLETEEKGGLPVSKKLSALLVETPDLKTSPEGTAENGAFIKKLYRSSLDSLIPEDSDFRITVSSSSCFSGSIGSQDRREEIIIQLSPDGRKAALYSDKSGFISYEGLILLYCRQLFEDGSDAALPYGMSYAADRLAAEHGRKILRYFSAGDGESDCEARLLAAKQRFSLDGLFLALSCLKILTQRGMGLENARSLIPEAHSLKKYLSVDCSKAEGILKSKRGDVTPDGTSFADKNGRILIRAAESGKGLWLNIESYSVEMASEICGKIEETVKKLESRQV